MPNFSKIISSFFIEDQIRKPVSWYDAPGIPSSRILSSVRELFDSTYRTSLFLVENISL